MTTRQNFSISPAAASAMLDVSSLPGNADWNLVVRFLHWNGTYYGLLNNSEHVAVRLLADGYGDLSSEDFDADTVSELLWDWSHVRDSSKTAIGRMAEWIRSFFKRHVR